MKISTSYTIDETIVEKVKKEKKRLGLSSNSFLVNKILEDYFEKIK